jgi:hypothetical protein
MEPDGSFPIHKGPPPVLIPRQSDPLQAFPSYFL